MVMESRKDGENPLTPDRFLLGWASGTLTDNKGVQHRVCFSETKFTLDYFDEGERIPVILKNHTHRSLSFSARQEWFFKYQLCALFWCFISQCNPWNGIRAGARQRWCSHPTMTRSLTHTPFGQTIGPAIITPCAARTT
jgi:hypothetical protein